MALTKEVFIGLVSILKDSQLQIREDTIVYEDGKELSKTYLRYTQNPGDDVSGKPQLIRDLAGLLWTPEVIEKWKNRPNPLEIING